MNGVQQNVVAKRSFENIAFPDLVKYNSPSLPSFQRRKWWRYANEKYYITLNKIKDSMFKFLIFREFVPHSRNNENGIFFKLANEVTERSDDQ